MRSRSTVGLHVRQRRAGWFSQRPRYRLRQARRIYRFRVHALRADVGAFSRCRDVFQAWFALRDSRELSKASPRARRLRQRLLEIAALVFSLAVAGRLLRLLSCFTGAMTEHAALRTSTTAADEVDNSVFCFIFAPFRSAQCRFRWQNKPFDAYFPRHRYASLIGFASQVEFRWWRSLWRCRYAMSCRRESMRARRGRSPLFIVHLAELQATRQAMAEHITRCHRSVASRCARSAFTVATQPFV